MRNQIVFLVHGKYALFTDPLTRMGGEKESYQIPTYESLVGVTSSIYWKPTLIWVIDQARVIKPIQMESKGTRPMDYNNSFKSNLSYVSYLRDVSYEVKAHFEFNKFRPDLSADWNENKHYELMKRSIRAGGRRDIFLGTRECQAYVEPLTGFGENPSAYDDIPEMNFGLMFHGFNYPDQTGNDQLDARFWKASMKHGVIDYPRPDACEFVRSNVRKMSAKDFNDHNFTYVDREMGDES
ncbi:type I-C CRISPR-associated protein Cas5c [Lapidilactobacillus achengensis]|uniref:pre-crRNA processing endonuclease n=1 Tax=Lapidilactobacillus achengensis TaxID=2486000 RepID=A0ABW1UKB5_9LACO|nr:type I-C CRISPR-associated protein Cas5c [Lapidilactobacillus achengensis]